jgi:hypothetical protein
MFPKLYQILANNVNSFYNYIMRNCLMDTPIIPTDTKYG